MFINLATEYAIIALSKLERHTDTPQKIHDIAKSERLSEDYLRKVFQKLQHAGIVGTTSGPHGGVSLSASPDRISMKDILQAAQGQGIWRCDKHPPAWCKGENCRFRKLLKKSERLFVEFLETKKLSDITSA